jgi:hypothetical protein
LKEFEAVLTMTSAPLKKSTAGHDLKWLASQTLFSTLDHMNRWLRKKYLSLTAKLRTRDDPDQITGKDRASCVRIESKKKGAEGMPCLLSQLNS